MSEMPPDLFAAAGIVLDAEPLTAKPKRARRPPPPSPAERAAAGRREGARRSKGLLSPGQRARVGEARDLGLASVLAFPLVRNAAVVEQVVARLPHGYDDKLETSCEREARNIEKRLLRRGVSKQSARACAMDVLHEAFTKRVNDAHREAGIT